MGITCKGLSRCVLARARRTRAPRRKRACSGQMTVELAVAFPVLIAVAVICVNAITFFSECAVFDRAAHEAVRVHAASPAYGQGPDQSCALVEQELRSLFDAENLDVSVARSGASYDFDRYTATLSFAPTLFGMGLRDEIFGVSMPRLVHSTDYVVDVYKPGVVV